MKLWLKFFGYLLAANLMFWGSVYAASELQLLEIDKLQFSPFRGPAEMPGVFPTFDFSRIPEMNLGLPVPILPIVPIEQFEKELKYPFGSHRAPFSPASLLTPPKIGESVPIVDSYPLGKQDINEMEEDLHFVSDFYTDTALYGNFIGGAENLSSRKGGFFYQENIRYDFFTLKRYDDSLAFRFDTTYSNDKREYRESFTLNNVLLESRTPKSLLAAGNTYPEFSRYTVTQPILGFYGVQKLESTTLKGFSGYRAFEKDDIKNPRYAYGVRVEHSHDDSVTLGINAVATQDSKSNPGADQDLPTLKNRIFSFDVNVIPTDNISIFGEYGNSKTEFDLRNPIGEQKDGAYRFGGRYLRENCRVEGGVEQAGSGFLSPLGESLTDERAYYGSVYYKLNRYFSTIVRNRISRDNLEGYKAASIVRNLPEMGLTMCPSDYYKDMRFDFHYQPFHEYSENVNLLDRYKDILWLELNHRAGAFRYFANLNSTTDKDKISPITDNDIYRFDFKLTWDYDNFRSVYGLFSQEQLRYITAGGFDKVRIYGLGGSSQFQDTVFLGLEYTHESNSPKGLQLNSEHDRVTFSLSKEYNNFSRFILEIEGSQNDFEAFNRDFQDLSTKIRYLKKF